MAQIKHVAVALFLSFSLLDIYAQRIECQATIQMNSDISPDAEMDSMIAVNRAELAEFMNETIGTSATTMSAVRPESDLTRLLSDIFLAQSQRISNENPDIPTAQIALLNIGGIRANLPEGNVTRGNIFEIAPFENSIVIQQFTGVQLREICNHIAQRGGEAVAGVRFQIIDNQAQNILVNKMPLNDNEIYTLATIDYLAHGGDGFDMLCKSMTYETQIRIRDAFIDYIKSHADTSLVAPTDVRISIIDNENE